MTHLYRDLANDYLGLSLTGITKISRAEYRRLFEKYEALAIAAGV